MNLTEWMAYYMQATIKTLQKAVEMQYSGHVFFAQSVPVKESYDGKTWQGVVCIFDIVDNTNTTRAYAWSARIKGREEQRLFVVLHKGAIKSPRDAVRAAIAAGHRGLRYER
jgi:hypothetical protein